MGGFTQVLLLILRDVDRCHKSSGGHRAACPGLWIHKKILSTWPGSTNTRESLILIDCYMDDVIPAVQEGTEHQHQVFDVTVSDLKWLFPSLPGEFKDSASVKKILTGEGEWT